jgi:hypothetical protein
VTDARAKQLFEKLGIACEREPDWIAVGQKPDFYCVGRQTFWCEVKTLERTEDTKQLGRALAQLRARVSTVSGTGQGIAYIGNRLSHRHAKVVTHLVKRAVNRFRDPDAPASVIALIPRHPDCSKFVRFAISTRDSAKVEFHSCVSSSGKYSSPSRMLPEPYDQTTLMRFSSGEERGVPAGDVVEPADDFHVAIVIDNADRPFDIIAAMPTGAARRLKNPERIRGAVSDANDQFRNAIKYKAAPCVLLIFHDGLDVPDESIIKSALYGNLKYAFSKERPGEGRLILDRDGAWNPGKNRTTSAAVYVRNNGEPLVIHNYWAQQPLRAGMFACREVAALRNGAFEEADFSPGAAIKLIERLRRLRFRAHQILRSMSA